MNITQIKIQGIVGITALARSAANVTVVLKRSSLRGFYIFKKIAKYVSFYTMAAQMNKWTSLQVNECVYAKYFII